MPHHSHPTNRLWHSTTRTIVIGLSLALATCVANVSGPRVAHADTPYEVFIGPVNAFYDIPSPLPAGAPGDLIRVQDVSATPTTITKRIMYHSVDERGRDRATIGMISYPTAPAPPGGWPVLSIANGTVGLASKCAVSRNGQPVPTFGLNAVGVASDYIGMGSGETQVYLSRKGEGHSVIDAVRAARNLTATGAGTRFVVVGGSQGGHGALAANELASSYAPELQLLGTVALAPAAMFDRTYSALDKLVTRVVGAMGFFALVQEYPEIHFADYMTPAGNAAISTIGTMCTDDIIPTVLGVPFDEFYAHDPIKTEPARSLILANDVGNVRANSPVYLVQGTADTTVFPERTRDLYARMCGVGQDVYYTEIEGADHATVVQQDLPAIEKWLADRVDGKPAASNCPPQAAGKPSTSTTLPMQTQPATAAVAKPVAKTPTFTG